MKRRALLIALALIAVYLAACARPPEPLPVYQSIPAFQLTAQDGRAFLSAAELSGHVWVADFIFTTCTGPCPRMSRQMKQVAEATHTFPNVRYVSFTVDPRNDTPEVLA
ncbi:MAG: SCO family protein, partial [Acidobacteriota bacterium]